MWKRNWSHLLNSELTIFLWKLTSVSIITAGYGLVYGIKKSLKKNMSDDMKQAKMSQKATHGAPIKRMINNRWVMDIYLPSFICQVWILSSESLSTNGKTLNSGKTSPPKILQKLINNSDRATLTQYGENTIILIIVKNSQHGGGCLMVLGCLNNFKRIVLESPSQRAEVFKTVFY